MKRPVILTPLAEADIQRERNFYEEKSEGLGNAFVRRVNEAIENIANNPIGYAPILGQLRRASLRKFPLALWFVVDDDGSIVIGCLHHKTRATDLARRRITELGKLQS